MFFVILFIFDKILLVCHFKLLKQTNCNVKIYCALLFPHSDLHLSFSGARFFIPEIYDLDILSFLAISRSWSSGSASMKRYCFLELIFSMTSSTMMSELQMSASVSAFPSASELIGSLMDTSVSWCFVLRKFRITKRFVHIDIYLAMSL